MSRCVEFKTWSVITCYTKDGDLPLLTDNNIVSTDIVGSLTQVVNILDGYMKNMNITPLDSRSKANVRKNIAECVDNNEPYCLNIEHGGNMLSFRVSMHILGAGIKLTSLVKERKEQK